MTYRALVVLASTVLVLAGCDDDSSPPNVADGGASANDGSAPPIDCDDAPLGRWSLIPRSTPTCMNELRTLEVREAATGRLRLLSEDFDLEANADVTCGFDGIGCSFKDNGYDEYVVRLTAGSLIVDYRRGRGSGDTYGLRCQETVTFDLEATTDCSVSGEFVLNAPFVSTPPLEGVCAELGSAREIRIDAEASELVWGIGADTVEVTGCAIRAEGETNWGPDIRTLGPRTLTLDVTVEGPALRANVREEWRPGGEVCVATGAFTATRRATTATGLLSLDTFTHASGLTCEEERPALCGDGVCEAGPEGCGRCPEDCGCEAGLYCDGVVCRAPCDPLDASTCDDGLRCEQVGEERRCVDAGPVGLGEVCRSSRSCANGLSCDAVLGSGVCAPTCAVDGGDCDTVCVAPEGERFGACRIACQAHETGTCPGGAICRREFIDGDVCTPRSGRSLLPVGSACRFNSECEESTSCLSINGAPSQCIKLCLNDTDCPAATPTCRFEACSA